MLAFDGCDPGANPWVEKYFHDCVMDYRDAVGFALGLCSIFVWLTAQLPQFISNVNNQSSEALSIWFLVEWFAGDTLNLLGCLIQGQQLPTTTMLAAYFVLMDVIMLLQYIYYGAVQARRKRLRARAHRKRHQAHLMSRDATVRSALRRGQDGGSGAPTRDASYADGTAFLQSAADPNDASVGAGRPAWSTATVTAATAAGLSIVCVAALALRPASLSPAGLSGGATAGTWLSPGSLRIDSLSRRHLLTVEGITSPLMRHVSGAAGANSIAAAGLASTGGDAPGGASNGDGDSSGGCTFPQCDVALVAGTAMGYLSTCFYLASRVSQIRKNLARKSTEGLSRYMFLLTISANLCTGVSIVLRLRSLEQLKAQLPWMCGTFGTIALDATLFHQVITLAPSPHDHHDHHHHHHHHHHNSHAHGHGHGQAQGLVAAEGSGPGSGPGEKPSDLETPLLLGGAGDEEGVAGAAVEVEVEP